MYTTHPAKVSEVTQSCPTLGDLVDYSLPGSFVHGTFQARTLKWVAISLSGGLIFKKLSKLSYQK